MRFFFSEIPSLKLAYPLKMDGWKTFSFPFWGWPIFSGVCGWFWGGEISPTGWCCYVPRSDGQRNHRPLENKAVRVRVKTIWRCISYLNNDHFPWPCYFTSTSVPQEIEKSSVFFSSLDFDSNLGFSDEQGSLDHFTLLDLIPSCCSWGSKTTQLHKDIHSSKLT